MKAIALSHPDFSKEALLKLAEEIPGAWIGLRIAGYLLMLSGWSAPKVAMLFGLHRWSVLKWSQKAQKEGISALYDKQRKGRPSQFDPKKMKRLDQALLRPPKDFGFSRARWDGPVVVEYLRKFFGIQVHVRHAQRLIRQLGYALRQPTYRYVQATGKGVRTYLKTIKKTPQPADGGKKEGSAFC